MKRRIIIKLGDRSLFIEDETMSKHLILRTGTGTRSYKAILSIPNARKLAYALMGEADRLEYGRDIVREMNKEIVRSHGS